MEIRALTPEDVAACAALMVGTPLWQRYGVTEDGAQRTFVGVAAGDGCGLVALIENEIVGFILYYPRGAFARSGYIRLIGVAGALQGKGVGVGMMRAAEADMASTSRDVFLLVSDFNTDAQLFYRRLGYSQAGALPDYVLPDVAELIFRKTLDAGRGRTGTNAG